MANIVTASREKYCGNWSKRQVGKNIYGFYPTYTCREIFEIDFTTASREKNVHNQQVGKFFHQSLQVEKNKIENMQVGKLKKSCNKSKVARNRRTSREILSEKFPDLQFFQ